MDRQRVGFGVVLALVGGVVLAIRAASSGRGTDAASPIDGVESDAGMIIPAATADSEGALPLRIQASDAPKGRRLTLEAGGGAAVLTIQEARGRSDFGGFGKCTLEAPDRDKGAAFVHAVARWLGQPDGAGRRPQQPLAPVPCTYALLGGGRDPSGRSWVVRKLFFETRGDTAEVYLRVSPDEARAELLEKDEDYRAPLIDALGVALRDGPTPRRTTRTDPNLAADEPVVSNLAPLAGDAKQLGVTAWAGARLLAASHQGKQSAIRLWERLDQAPRDVARLDGYAQALHVDPTGARAVVILVHPEREGAISSSDPGSAAIVELASGLVTPLLAGDPSVRLGMLTSVAWASHGDALVLDGDAPAPDGSHAGSVAVALDASGHRIDATAPSLDVRPTAWSKRGVELLHNAVDPTTRESKPVHYLWQPGKGEPAPAAAPSRPELASPDGRYRLRLDGDALVVAGGGADRRFTSAREEDKGALEGIKEGSASWLGPAGLLLQSDDMLVLDLESMKLRLLLPPGDLRFETATPDGKIVVVKQDDAVLMWGTTGGKIGSPTP